MLARGAFTVAGRWHALLRQGSSRLFWFVVLFRGVVQCPRAGPRDKGLLVGWCKLHDSETRLFPPTH